MIHVRPAKLDEIKEIFGDTITDHANAMIAEDCNTGEKVGYSKFEICDGRFTLFDVVPTEKDIWLCDLITRATMVTPPIHSRSGRYRRKPQSSFA